MDIFPPVLIYHFWLPEAWLRSSVCFDFLTNARKILDRTRAMTMSRHYLATDTGLPRRPFGDLVKHLSPQTEHTHLT